MWAHGTFHNLFTMNNLCIDELLDVWLKEKGIYTMRKSDDTENIVNICITNYNLKVV